MPKGYFSGESYDENNDANEDIDHDMETPSLNLQVFKEHIPKWGLRGDGWPKCIYFEYLHEPGQTLLFF
jgi:hypothetical protein